MNISVLPNLQTIGLKCCFIFQASHLDSEVTKLRAQLERGEAVRQSLEFELAKARKVNSYEKKSVIDRENLIAEINDNMKRKDNLLLV